MGWVGYSVEEGLVEGREVDVPITVPLSLCFRNRQLAYARGMLIMLDLQHRKDGLKCSCAVMTASRNYLLFWFALWQRMFCSDVVM